MYAQETGRQSGVRLCIMARLPTDLVQELNVGTVDASRIIQIMAVVRDRGLLVATPDYPA